MTQKLTVICRELNSGYSDVLIYAVEADATDQDAVTGAVEEAREADLGEHVAMEVLFAYAGDINTVADWRD